MRAMQPVDSGIVTLEGFQVAYESFGNPAWPAVLLLPPWQIVHSRIWKMQVPYLARSFRVVTFDPPGNGNSERTADPTAYEFECVARIGLGLLDQLGIQRSALAGYSRSCAYALWLAATAPERVERLVLIANGVTPDDWGSGASPEFFERRETYDGWQRYNAHYWREHYDEWLEFFFTQLFPEPHSTKGIEDGIGWGHETTAETLIHSTTSPHLRPAMPPRDAIRAIRCPVLLLHGDCDDISPIETSRTLALARPDWQMITLAGCSHGAVVRDPVRVNLFIHDFLAASTWHPEGR
ncbi:MAG TPA: alpha/beta hydrolase [Thermomicrobiales bacterium]|nr:alpha/beta hydrolase [Thermomicrobiales bacterium]